MNYLAHLFLSPENNEVQVGNLMGDFVKGNRFSHLPKGVVEGIYLHRAIDKFTDHHPVIKQLKLLLSLKRRKFHGIITDIAFDHFLACQWQQYSEQPLTLFSQTCYQSLEQHKESMPDKMQMMVKRMIAGDWLMQYQQTQSMIHAINGVSKRIRFDNELKGGGEEVMKYYAEYNEAFEQFFPQLQAFCLRYYRKQGLENNN